MSDTGDKGWIQPDVKCWAWNISESQYDLCIVEQVDVSKQKAKVMFEKESSESSEQEIQFNHLFEYESHEQKEIQHPMGYVDMVQMKYLNEAEILANIRFRYNQDKIFTWIGPTLIAINPYKTIADQQESQSVSSTRNAHTFCVSENAFKEMLECKKNQAILISGESGAGKTENAKLAMQYLTRLSQSEVAVDTAELRESKNIIEDLDQFTIEDKILACNPILEAFGNAKTVRNDNSSRFGKYVKIFVHKISHKIQGASISNYLLEKSRVAAPAVNERNYHVFYHLLCDSPEILESLQLSPTATPQDFNYLSKTGCFEIKNIPDAKLLLEVKKAFRSMNFKQQEQQTIFSILAAILHLGNAELSEKIDAQQQSQFSFMQTSQPRNSTSQTRWSSSQQQQQLRYSQSPSPFKKVCELLEISPEQLEEALVMKTLKIGQSIILSPQSQTQCISLRDSLSKNLYDALFTYLVNKMNKRLLPPPDLAASCLSVGLLDIFGFESFETNSFEQLCINFTNEKFHQLYVNYVFKSEEEEYRKEMIFGVFDNLQYNQNQNIIDILEKKPAGILILLDESCSLGSSSDEMFLSAITKNHSKNPLCSFPKRDRNAFCLSHTAKQVVYNVQGFREKNKDEVSNELQVCLSQSTNPLIASLFQQNPSEGKVIVKKSKFLGLQFRQQLSELLGELSTCGAHFIRCIKPNEEKQPNQFNYLLVFQQVQYLGLLDSIKIRRVGYETRMSYEDFFLTYQELGQKTKGLTLQKVAQSKDIKSLRELIIKDIFKDQMLLRINELNEKSVAFGKTKIFLLKEALTLLRKMLSALIEAKQAAAKKITRAIRKHMFRKNWKVFLEKIRRQLVKVQAFIRMQAERRKFLRKKKSIEKMKRIQRLRIAAAGIRGFRQNLILYQMKLLAAMIFSKTNLHEAFEKIQKQPKKQVEEVQRNNGQIKENEKIVLHEQFEESKQTAQSQKQKDKSPKIESPKKVQASTPVNKNLLKIVQEVTKQDQEIQFTQHTSNSNSKNIMPNIVDNNSAGSSYEGQQLSQGSWRQTNLSSWRGLGLNSLGLGDWSGQPPNGSSKHSSKTSLIVAFTELNPASCYSGENESNINLEEVPESEDCHDDKLSSAIDTDMLNEIQKSDYRLVVGQYLARRTKWGIAQPPEKILRHQLKPISHPLTNIEDLKKAITFEDTKDTVNIIRSIASQLALKYSEATPFAQQFEDAQPGYDNDSRHRSVKPNSSSSRAVLAARSSSRSKTALQDPRKASIRGTISLENIKNSNNNNNSNILPKQITQMNSNQSPEEKAVNVFKTLLKCADERKSRYNRCLNVIKLLSLINEDTVELKEEVYLQLMKQLNDNGSSDSRLKYLKIFAIVSSMLPTTSRFFYYLLNFLFQKINACEQGNFKEEGKFYQFCMLRLIRSQQIQRCFIPSETELFMIENRKQIMLRVYLLNEVPITIGVESYTSVKNLKSMILDRIGVKSRHEFYGIIESRVNKRTLKKEQRFVDEDERIMDVIAFWEAEQNQNDRRGSSYTNNAVEHSQSLTIRQHSSSSIVHLAVNHNLLKSENASKAVVASSKSNFEDSKIFLDLDGLKIYLGIRISFSFEESDQEAASVFYAQIYSEVQNGKYTPLQEKDYLNLAGLQLCVDYPQEQIQNVDLKNSTLQFDTSFYIPESIHKSKSADEWRTLILQNLSEKQLTKRDRSMPQKAKLAYILYLSKQDLFMSSVFKGVKYQRVKQRSLHETISSKEKFEQMVQETEQQQSQQIEKQAIKDEILLAINPSNILMCDPYGFNRPKRRVPIRNILKFCCTSAEVIVVDIDNTKHIFETPPFCKEIAFLVRSYLRIHFQKQQ